MATASEAQLVKSLNTGPGRNRFVFKSFSDRIEEVEIDVYRSLDQLKAEPSKGSTFFRDCLMEMRELNTAEDFISFYEEMTPLVQTLAQILHHKDFIFDALLSRLHMKGKLSLEPILRLAVELSRDLVDDFSPFLQKLADSIVKLLESGADKEPDIIKQIFTSWSSIMMYLCKHLVKNVAHVLGVTAKLISYRKDYVRELAAESLSFLLRNAPSGQLRKGVREIMIQVAEMPTDLSKSGLSALLWYSMRGTSSNLHSKAKRVISLLIEKTIFDIGGEFVQGNCVVKVVIETFQRLCEEELPPKDFNLMWKCLHKEIEKAVSSGYLLHLSHLLCLLISTIQPKFFPKISDHQPIIKLVELLVQQFVLPTQLLENDDNTLEVVNLTMQLILCVLDGLHLINNVSDLNIVCRQCLLVFRPGSSSLLLPFIKELLLKNPLIVVRFRHEILSAIGDFIENSEEEAIYLLLKFFRIGLHDNGFLDGINMEEGSKISSYLQNTLRNWIRDINQISQIQLQENSLALLWGVINCCSSLKNMQFIPELLLDLAFSLDNLLETASGSEFIARFHMLTWQSLIGAALRSYNNLLSVEQIKSEIAGQFLQLAIRYKSSSHILSAVADLLDNMDMATSLDETSNLASCQELQTQFAENLWHKDKIIRISSLKIFHYYEISQSCHGINIFQRFLSIEETSLPDPTSRKLDLMLSEMQMAISANTISGKYIPVVLYGLVGILHNRFRPDPVLECLSTLISQHFEIVWDIFILSLEKCQSDFVASHIHDHERETMSTCMPSDLVVCFHGFVFPSLSYDTPCSTPLLSLLIKTLQKIPTLVESRILQIVPLFLKFMGYNTSHVFSVQSFDSKVCKGKEWGIVLKEWLNLFKLMNNLKYFYRDQDVKQVLEFRLLDEQNEEIQTKVLDCLLNWKDEFVVPYSENLKELINSKSLRETLTTWSLSKQSPLIQENHRTHLVSLVTRLLIPKVRKIKALASRKSMGVHHRKAILGFLAQLDVDELPLFFSLLIKPLLSTSERSSGISKDEFDSFNLLENLTMDNIIALSWKKKYGFLHVVEDILGVFDESHLKPYLNLLLGCIVRILFSCTSTLESCKSTQDEKSEALCTMMTRTGTKQLRELRSFCLKIIAFILNKYEEHDFGCEFWDMFFNSVKPLIDGFKKEGSSSEKPSSLFSCFLAMSKSYKLAPFLDVNKNIIPSIFSNLEAYSEAISTSVLKFVENLLNLETELDQKDNIVKRLLLPNLDSLFYGLQHHFKLNKVARRKGGKCPGEREINIFKLLSKYIKHPLEARQYVDIMLPILAIGVRNSDACVEALQVIRHLIPVLNGESTTEILNAVSPLLIYGSLEIRKFICELLDVLSGVDSSLMKVTEFVREVSATDTTHMGGLDYDRAISAYEHIDKEIDFFYTMKEKHALLILSHAVHDMLSEEMILRQSGYGLLLSFIKFSAKILNRKLDLDNLCWSEVCIEKIITKFLFKYMGDAMNKEPSVQKVWIDLLREMVSKIPMVNNLQSFQNLWSNDPDKDFFYNIIHLQKCRRAKALLRFQNFASSCNSSEVITNRVFLPLFLKMLYDEQDGNAEDIRRACLEAIAIIAGKMKWKSYYAFLLRCFRQMVLKPDKEKVLLRLISSVLGRFRFLEGSSNSAEASEIQSCLKNVVLPKIQKLLASDSEKLNVNISLISLKLLKFLPSGYMDLQLPSIIHRISNFLKSRLESIRDEARTALSACLKELGIEYLNFIVGILRATLKRGFEVHVLGYTLHFILSKTLVTPSFGKLDYCLQEILSIVENDIFGDVSELKEVEKIASKMKETRNCKSFETLELISRNVTFVTHAEKLLLPVRTHLRKLLTAKEKSKIEKMINNIAAGIQGNVSVNLTDLLIFLYGLILEEGVVPYGNNVTAKQYSDEAKSKIIKNSSSQSSHLIKVFALGILHNCIKNVEISVKNEELLSRVDPFVRLLSECLNSKYEDVISAAFRCLYVIVKLPLPSLVTQAEKIKTSLLFIAQESVNTSSSLVQSCLKLLTALLQKPRIKLSTAQLHMVVQFPPFIDLEKNPSNAALSLLKTIVTRGFNFLEIYNLVDQVKELMVKSQVEMIRNKCRQILLSFLLDYPLSKKCLKQHLDFLLSNLRYEHPSGRESVLEMLHAVAEKFPEERINEYSEEIFLNLVLSLANDPDKSVRSMACSALKHLIGRVSSQKLISFMDYSLFWYQEEKQQQIRSAGAQALGLLVEAMGSSFVDQVLLVMKSIFHSALDVLTNKDIDISIEGAIPFWKEAYYSLILLEKIILHKSHDLCLRTEMEDIWEAISELLLHPHIWIHDVSNRLLALYFSSATKAKNPNGEQFSTLSLINPNKLFLICVFLCWQLKAMPTDTIASTVITQNLSFGIVTLHSLFLNKKGVDLKEFMSTLEKQHKVGFLKASNLLSSGERSGMFASLISGEKYKIVSFFLKWMGKIAIQMEDVQMKTVFNIYKLVSKEILSPENPLLESTKEYAHEMLLPLDKVCEGYAGKVVHDEVIQLAQEARQTIEAMLESSHFKQVIKQIREPLEKKREKRKREERIMAVVNPMRNAKRKLRIASKNKANKRRRVMTMKMTRWTR